MFLIFDTETTGLPKRWNAPISDTDNWPRCVQIAWQLHDEFGRCIEHKDFLVTPEGYDIPYDSEKIHGISTALATERGVSLDEVLDLFNEVLKKSKFIVGQNVGFDVNIMGAEFYRKDIESNLADLPVLDTCTEHTANLCKIPGGRGGKFKLPTLTELHQFLFGTAFNEAHNATADVEATTRCFFELIRLQQFSKTELQVEDSYFDSFKIINPDPIDIIGLKHVNLKKESAKLAKKDVKGGISNLDLEKNKTLLEGASYSHLHNHSQFSILQSTISVGDLVKAATKANMDAVALTDHGNMMGAFHFVNAVSGYNKGIKKEREAAQEKGEEFNKKELVPIVGCEFFVCENHLDKSIKDNGYQVVLLAKKQGWLP